MRYTRDEICESLAKVPLFHGLPAGPLGQLADSARVHTYAAREDLFSVGDRDGRLFLLLRGTVSVSVPTPDGRLVHLADRGEGEHVGELSMLDGRRRSATITANEEVVCAILDRDKFFAVLERSPALQRNVVLSLTLRLREATESTVRERRADVMTRLCAVLTELYEASGERIPLRQHELAERIGATRESVNRAIARLQRENVAIVQGRVIVLQKPDAVRVRAGLE